MITHSKFPPLQRTLPKPAVEVAVMIRFLMVLSILAGSLCWRAGAATYETLHVFTPDPAVHPLQTDNPSAPLLMNSKGTVIYGVLKSQNPIAYALALTPSGSWTKSTIFTFPIPVNEGGIGCYPIDGMALDGQGNIFGAVTGCYSSNTLGAIYELSPPKNAGGNWTGGLIYRFGQTVNDLRNPILGSLLIETAGNLYGGAVNHHQTQTIYKLVRPASPSGWVLDYIWRLPVYYDQQSSWMIRDASGAIYGEGFGDSDSVAGNVWKLTPASDVGSALRYSDLVTFPFCSSTTCPKGGAPSGYLTGDGLVMDRAGHLYGTARAGGLHNHGVVFELTPPVDGKTKWSIFPLHSFNGTDGNDPQGLTIDSVGNLYGVALYGGIGWQENSANSGNGVVYELSPPVTPDGAWTFKILHEPAAKFFTISASSGASALEPHLILGPDKKLYGAANGPVGSGGSVFRITP